MKSLLRRFFLSAKAALSARAEVIQLAGTATSQIVASGRLDVAESEKLWASPLGQILINLFGTFIISLYMQWCAGLSGQQIEEEKRAVHERSAKAIRRVLAQ